MNYFENDVNLIENKLQKQINNSIPKAKGKILNTYLLSSNVILYPKQMKESKKSSFENESNQILKTIDSLNIDSKNTSRLIL